MIEKYKDVYAFLEGKIEQLQEAGSSVKSTNIDNKNTLKEDLIEVVINKLSPIREEMIKLLDNHDYLQGILDSGSLDAQKIAKKVLKEVYDVTGLNSAS